MKKGERRGGRKGGGGGRRRRREGGGGRGRREFTQGQCDEWEKTKKRRSGDRCSFQRGSMIAPLLPPPPQASKQAPRPSRRPGYLVRGVVRGQVAHGIATPLRHVSVPLVRLQGLHHRGNGPGRTQRILHPRTPHAHSSSSTTRTGGRWKRLSERAPTHTSTHMVE